MVFRQLNANEIDCRISTVTSKGVSLLLYKDARVDQRILDETVGCMNWQRRHTRDNANCIVSIWDPEKGMWIEKEDTGTESNTEKEKGLASDSFKRACFNWGIGRELYSAPFIWIPSGNGCTVSEMKDRPGKYTCNDRFSVVEIGYDEERNINTLTIRNDKTKDIVWSIRAEEQRQSITPLMASAIRERMRKLDVNEEGVCKLYKVSAIEDMTAEAYSDLAQRLNRVEKKREKEETADGKESETN